MVSLNGEILEVFARLPAKLIIKFQSVCKDTKSYLSETFFHKEQSQNMLAKDDSGILLVQYERVELCGSSLCLGVPPESMQFLSSTNGAIASSNGLVCGRMKNENKAPLFICNPVTKSWVSIPLPNGLNSGDFWMNLVFECLNKDDYLLMIIMGDPDGDWSGGKYLTKIYAPKEGVWKDGGDFIFGGRNMHNYNRRPVYINSSGGGSLVYFMSDTNECCWLKKSSPYYWPYVVGYNIKTSSSHTFKIPKEARKGIMDNNCMLNIFKWVYFDRRLDQSTVCLIKLRNTVFTVWVLEELEWKMVLRRPAWLMGVQEPNISIMDYTVINGKQLIIATKRRMHMYDLWSGGKAKEICSIECERYQRMLDNLLPYSNTLRPCGDGAMPLPATKWRYRCKSRKLIGQ